MNRMLPLLALALTGCEELAPLLDDFLPEVRFQTLTVDSINFEEAAVDFVFDVDNPNPVDIELASDTVFIFGAAVYDTVTVRLAGTGATAHQPVAHSAAGVADTATTFGTTAVYIDLASDTIFVFGAAVYDTVTIIFAGTETIVHGPVTHIAAVVADTAPAFGATVVDIDLADDDIFIFGAVFDIVSIGFADADAITHGPVARIAAVVADNAIVTRDSCIYDRSHPSVGKHNRMKPTMR